MTPRTSHFRGLLFAFALLFVFTLSLPVLPYLWLTFSSDTAAENELQEQNSRASFWRSVRRGNSGYTAVPGREAGVLIHGNGINWSEYRSKILVPFGSYLMGIVLFLIAVFFAARGRIPIEKGLSGKPVLRFSVYQRTIHWFTAILFWLLALSGLVLLYGRYILIPLLGAKVFAIIAAASKEAHNLFGPLFLLALILMVVLFIRDNLFQKGDINWLKNGGGMFGTHASAGKFNFGEKIWFWLVCVLGLTVSISGIALNFSALGLDRTAMDLAHVIHSAAAVVFISVSFGHIYLGTIGTQGTLEGMTKGTVDASWAELHHDRWIPDPKDQEELLNSASMDIADTSRE